MDIDYFEILDVVKEYFPKSSVGKKGRKISIMEDYNYSSENGEGTIDLIATIKYNRGEQIYILSEKVLKEDIYPLKDRKNIGNKLDFIAESINVHQVSKLSEENFEKPKDLLHYRNFPRE